MQYHVVTSLNKKYWELGADINVQSWDKHFPTNVTIHVYSEDGPLGNFSSRVKWYNLYEECPALLSFQQTHKDDPHYNGEKNVPEKQKYKWRAIKFAHKTFALFNARHKVNNWLIWLDADVLCFKTFNELFLSQTCPEKFGISYLGRPTTHSECGFVGYNLKNKTTQEFLDAFEDLYKDKNLLELAQTHDSFVFDYVRRQYNKDLFFDLNKDAENNKHPFHSSILRRHLVHSKGHDKKRKQEKMIRRYKL